MSEFSREIGWQFDTESNNLPGLGIVVCNIYFGGFYEEVIELNVDNK